MALRLRQIALVAADLAAAEVEIESALGVSLCYRDPGVGEFGLHNALWPIGDKLLEVVSPMTEGTTAGRLLEKRGGDCGYMVILQTDDLDGFKSRFDELGIRVVWAGSRPGISGMHLHPRDVGGAILSIDQTDDWENWAWAGQTWREHCRDSATDILGVQIQAEDPQAMAQRWSEVLDREAVDNRIRLDEGEIHFVSIGEVAGFEATGEGVVGLDVQADSDDQLTVCGTRFRLMAVN